MGETASNFRQQIYSSNFSGQKNEIQSDYALKNGDLVRFDHSDYQWDSEYDKPDIGYFDAIYKFLGDNQSDIVMASEDFQDGTRWEYLGNEFTSFPYQLTGGDTDLYLLDNDINSEAAGAKVSLALNFSLLNSRQIAESRIKGNVQINQRNTLYNAFDQLNDSDAYNAAGLILSQPLSASDRNLSLDSQTINQSVDWVGNKTSTDTSISFLKKLYALNGASESGNGVGASVFLNNVTTKSQSIVEDGAIIYADKVSVKADTDVLAISAGYAGGSGSASLGIAGLYMHNIIDSTAIAQVESGVTLVAGAENVGSERLTVVADNRLDLIVGAGVMGYGGSLGVGASAVVSEISKVSKALVGTEGQALGRDGNITINGDAQVKADSSGL
ncbi:MAG: hypothetical protein ACPGEF_07625, partial [Endozoicomonas sp.]